MLFSIFFKSQDIIIHKKHFCNICMQINSFGTKSYLKEDKYAPNFLSDTYTYIRCLWAILVCLIIITVFVHMFICKPCASIVVKLLDKRLSSRNIHRLLLNKVFPKEQWVGAFKHNPIKRQTLMICTTLCMNNHP